MSGTIFLSRLCGSPSSVNGCNLANQQQGLGLCLLFFPLSTGTQILIHFSTRQNLIDNCMMCTSTVVDSNFVSACNHASQGPCICYMCTETTKFITSCYCICMYPVHACAFICLIWTYICICFVWKYNTKDSAEVKTGQKLRQRSIYSENIKPIRNLRKLASPELKQDLPTYVHLQKYYITVCVST